MVQYPTVVFIFLFYKKSMSIRPFASQKVFVINFPADWIVFHLFRADSPETTHYIQVTSTRNAFESRLNCSKHSFKVESRMRSLSTISNCGIHRAKNFIIANLSCKISTAISVDAMFDDQQESCRELFQ